MESSPVYYLCDVPLTADNEKGWFDFVVRYEYSFLKNIYSYDDLKQMNIENKKSCQNIIRRLIKCFPLFESALQDSEICNEVRYFLLEDLDNCYSISRFKGDLREQINHISILKKIFL